MYSALWITLFIGFTVIVSIVFLLERLTQGVWKHNWFFLRAKGRRPPRARSCIYWCTKTPPEICTCKHLAPCEFPLQPSLMICSKACPRRCVCGWPEKAKLGKQSFWQQNKRSSRGKTRSWLVRPFRSPRAFCSDNYLLLSKDFLLEWWKRYSICFCVRVMLSKGNRIPQWRLALRANGRPRQIKSNGHLSCWQLKSHLSNYSWSLALRSTQSFHRRNKWCGARDHGLL